MTEEELIREIKKISNSDLGLRLYDTEFMFLSEFQEKKRLLFLLKEYLRVHQDIHIKSNLETLQTEMYKIKDRNSTERYNLKNKVEELESQIRKEKYEKLRDVIREVDKFREQLTKLYKSHIVATVEFYFDYLHFLDNGKLVLECNDSYGTYIEEMPEIKKNGG